MFGQKNILDEPAKLYHNERYGQHANPLNKENAKYLLSTLKNVFEPNGVKMILSYGTLLGAVREHDFIGHDSDMDVMIWQKDFQKAWELIPELEKRDVHLHCYCLPWIFTFEHKGETCDIDVLQEAIWPWNKRYCLTHLEYIPRAFFENTTTMEFLGETYTIPQNAEKVLEYHYGKKWRIPSNRSGRVESYVFFWRYAHRFMQRCIRYAKRHWFKQNR